MYIVRKNTAAKMFYMRRCRIEFGMTACGIITVRHEAIIPDLMRDLIFGGRADCYKHRCRIESGMTAHGVVTVRHEAIIPDVICIVMPDLIVLSSRT
jgi:hypothetical protein